jgi:hypothetical protein
MARAFGQRPSSLLDLDDDPLVAYAIDEALFVILRAADGERGRAPSDPTENPRGAVAPRLEDLVGVPVIGPDGVSRYLDGSQN